MGKHLQIQCTQNRCGSRLQRPGSTRISSAMHRVAHQQFGDQAAAAPSSGHRHATLHRAEYPNRTEEPGITVFRHRAGSAIVDLAAAPQAAHRPRFRLREQVVKTKGYRPASNVHAPGRLLVAQSGRDGKSVTFSNLALDPRLLRSPLCHRLLRWLICQRNRA